LYYITSTVDTIPINMQQPDLLCLKALCYVEPHFETIKLIYSFLFCSFLGIVYLMNVSELHISQFVEKQRDYKL